MRVELRPAVPNHPAHGEPGTLGRQQLLPFAFILQERRDERNPKIQSRIQPHYFFCPCPYERINQLTARQADFSFQET